MLALAWAGVVCPSATLAISLPTEFFVTPLPPVRSKLPLRSRIFCRMRWAASPTVPGFWLMPMAFDASRSLAFGIDSRSTVAAFRREWVMLGCVALACRALTRSTTCSAPGGPAFGAAGAGTDSVGFTVAGAGAGVDVGARGTGGGGWRGGLGGETGHC